MGFADDASGRARGAARKALNEIGRRVVRDIRFSIGIRVEYVGDEVIRSDPGEPPRREFSELWKSIKYKVYPKALSLEQLEVYTFCQYAPHLEYGFTHFRSGEWVEPRPFWAPAKKRATGLTQLARELVAEYIKVDQGSDAPEDPDISE